MRDRRHRLEIDILLDAMVDASGDRKLAAQRLRIILSSLYRKLGESTQD